MATIDGLEELSQQQHQRFYDLFGTNPASGQGFTNLATTSSQLGQQAEDTRTQVIGTDFSTAVIPKLADATTTDHVPFTDHARVAATAAQVSDASAQVNIRGAAAVLANSRNEAAQFNAIPDRDSPEGMLAALNTIDRHQAQSLDTVQQSAATQQQLGQKAASGGTHKSPDKHHGIQAVDFTTGPPQSPPPAPSPPDPGLPGPLQDFERQLQGLPRIPTPHPPVDVDELRQQIRAQIQQNHDDALRQLILDGQQHHGSTHDIVKALGEMAIAAASGIGGVAGAPETGGVSLYLGIAAALGSGALAIDDLNTALS